MIRLKTCLWLLVVCACAALVSCANPPANPAAPGGLPGKTADPATPRLNATTYFTHGHLLERQGNLEQALEQYRLALEVKPDFVTARNRLGITLNKLGRNPEASAQFRQALVGQPNLAYLHNNLGFSLFLENKFAGAEAEFARALQLNPAFTRARMNHALVLAKLERVDDAFGEFRLAGDEATAHYNLAMVLADAKRYDQAVRALDAALRLRPQFAAAKEQLHILAPLALQMPNQPAGESSGLAVAAAAVPVSPADVTEPPTQPIMTDASGFVGSAQPEPPETVGQAVPAAEAAPNTSLDESGASTPPPDAEPENADDCDEALPPEPAPEDLPEVPTPTRSALPALVDPLRPVPPPAPSALDQPAKWWPLMARETAVPWVTCSHDVFADFDLLGECRRMHALGREAWDNFWRELEAQLATQAVTSDPLSGTN
jgi:tetratricopeptide (TPR) repeat protein